MSIKRFHLPARLSRIVSTLGLAALFVLTLEIAARVDDWVHYGAPLFKRYEFDRLFQVDARGLHGAANAQYLRWRLNAEGLRGEDVRPDTGQIRILTYGASETFGIFEENGKEYPRTLERELNNRTIPDHYEILNAGLPGMRVGSGIALFKELASRFNPSVVVIYPTPTHYIGVSRPYCNRPPKPIWVNSDLWPGIRIGDKLREEFKKIVPPIVQHEMRKISIRWQTRDQFLLDQVDKISLEAFQTDLTCAIDAAHTLGVKPILVTHANRFGKNHFGDDAFRLTQWRQQYPELREEGFLDLEQRANEIVRTLAKTQDVPLVDADKEMSGETKWFADHVHFTNEGATALAVLLMPTILSITASSPR